MWTLDQELNSYDSELDVPKMIQFLQQFPNIQQVTLSGFQKWSCIINDVLGELQIRTNITKLILICGGFYVDFMKRNLEIDLQKLFPKLNYVLFFKKSQWHSDFERHFKLENVDFKHEVIVVDNRSTDPEVIYEYVHEMWKMHPILRTIPEFLTCDAVKRNFFQSISAVLNDIASGYKFEVDQATETFEERFMGTWKLLGFDPNKPTIGHFSIPHNNPFSPLCYTDLPANCFIRAGSAYMLSQTKGKGSFAANYNKWAESRQVKYAMEIAKFFILNGCTKEEECVRIGDMMDTNAQSAAMMQSSRRSNVKMFSWKEFVESCFEEAKQKVDDDVLQPSLKRRKL
jgi:hypothetical protein